MAAFRERDLWKHNMSDDIRIYEDISLRDFQKIISEEAVIISKVDVVCKIGSASTIHSHAGLEYHTDAPIADLVGLYCLNAGELGEFTEFLRIDRLLCNLGKRRILNLAETKLCNECDLSSADSLQKSYSTFPILYELDSHSPKINFAPWVLMKSGMKTPETDALQNEICRVGEHAQQISHKVGQGILWSNGRFLHGRPRLAPNSRRQLSRIWAKSV